MPPLIRSMKRHGSLLFVWGATILCIPATSTAQNLQQQMPPAAIVAGPDLDLSIHHYSRVLTAEGVLRESRYEETMIRRPGHVWVSRVLPNSTAVDRDEHALEGKEAHQHNAAGQPGAKGQQHKHFNHTILPRHVICDGQKVRLEFVNFHDREVVSIMPSEYENVNFDGSCSNAFFLVDPQSVAALPLSKQASPVSGARWREQEKNGLFQRVLWDEKRLIPLVVESGDRAGTFFRRVELKPQASQSRALPWLSTKGFAQKEYADFLD